MSAAPPPKPVGYEVHRSHGTCAVTGATFAPGEKFMTALRETPAGFERVDVSISAWPSFNQKDVLGFWQATMPSATETKRKVFVDDSVLMELFERLADVTEPEKVNFRFVLGLILMRKKLLAYESSRSHDGMDVWVMRPKGRESTLEMVNPHLDEEKVKNVSTQLGEILNQE